MKFSFVVLLLFMFIQFSRPHIFEQFDKMCKKKFLDYLDGIYDDDGSPLSLDAEDQYGPMAEATSAASLKPDYRT